MSFEAARDASVEDFAINTDLVSSKLSSWAAIARSKRQERATKLPREWLLPKAIIQKYAAHPISAFQDPIDPAISPGILSVRELQLTDTKHDATTLGEQLRSGSVSSEELTVAFCKRAAITHQLTNCLSEIMFKEAIVTARGRDAKMKIKGTTELKPLYGLPVTVKDSLFIKGYDASIGITALANKPSEMNSQIIDILDNNGAIIIAKTTVPQTMLCVDTISIVFGRTCNAYRGDLTAGGSTGGEGVLLAMGGSPLGIGTDGGGSVRMPAFLNGVFGYKPSGYRYPLDGTPVLGKGSTGIVSIGAVSVTGPLCRTVRDARMITKIVSDAEPWEKDSMLLPNPWLGVKAPQRPLRVGVWRNFDHVHPMPPVQRGYELAQRRLEMAGHVLVPFNGPSMARVWEHLRMLTEAMDLRYLRDLISTEPMTEIVRRTGILVPPKPNPELTLDDLYSLSIETNTLVRQMTKEWNQGSQPLDTLLWLPAPHPAVPFDEYTDLTFTCLFNIIDWPAVVLPLNEFITAEDVKQNGVNEDELFGDEDRRIKKLWEDNREKFKGLPLSVQLIGRRGQDEKLLAIAETIQDLIRS